jgi:ABC-2 type transport system permease protein
MIYGYLFPLIYLAAFGVLFRHEKIPLLRHVGEWLTVSVLGGACFGLPTTLVSERERGVWRRFRLTPVAAWRILASTVAARYVIIVSAGALQFAVAAAAGMTAPAHPVALWVAFSIVTLAFIGLGLVIAALADTVPAVQALGQCIFLPMLIIGSVAVPLAALPEWAQHVSAFFPGRYAVEILQACVTGAGLLAARFDLVALVVIGAAAAVAGAKLFRWDASQHFLTRGGKGWLVLVLAAWIAIGTWAETRGRATVAAPAAPRETATATSQRAEPPWMKLTAADVGRLYFRVPSDDGVVAPIASADDVPDEISESQLDSVRAGLPKWPPGSGADDAQVVRNLLCICAVPDVIQMPVERFLPLTIFDHLASRYPKDQLIKLLTWIALHPEDGEVLLDVHELGISGAVGDPELVRERSYIYAIKFIARLTGRKTR